MRLQVAAAPFLPPWPMTAGGLTCREAEEEPALGVEGGGTA